MRINCKRREHVCLSASIYSSNNAVNKRNAGVNTVRDTCTTARVVLKADSQQQNIASEQERGAVLSERRFVC